MSIYSTHILLWKQLGLEYIFYILSGKGLFARQLFFSRSITAVCEKVGTTRFGNKQNTPKPNLRVWLILGSSLGNWAIYHHKKGLILVK